MQLNEFVTADQPSGTLWGDRYKIPWDEPEFSRRMLDIHLSQESDLASRKLATVENHVRYLHETLLDSKPARILDLGCGPGLYASRLAALGHTVRAIDFSPASIEHAIEHNHHPDRCEFTLGDLRTVDFGGGYDLAVMIYGEFNAFSPEEIGDLLAKVHRALKSGGRFLAEAHAFDTIMGVGTGPDTWYKAPSGLFSDRPHLCLMQNHWYESERAAETVFHIVDAADGTVSTYRNTLQAWTESDYRNLLEAAGFTGVSVSPAWGRADPAERESMLHLSGIRA
ncbi:methyltransferase domain-containing protein [bacterium]|nr:methyltransferase domain-containing protein [bacterium]